MAGNYLQIDKLMGALVHKGGSDLHLVVGDKPMIRLHGRMHRLETKILTADDMVSLMKSVTPEKNQQELQESGTTDFAVGMHESRFRVSIHRQQYEDQANVIGIVMRLIPKTLLTWEQLNFPDPDIIKRLCMLPRGLVLVTGPTGSGKTTTLATLIDHINQTRYDHLITLEEPIEFVHPHKRCRVTQREIGIHLPDFNEGIRRALRMDPDIILVGEMRDYTTIKAATTAAETGHLVFGTLHTSSAPSTIERIVDSFPVNEQAQIRAMLTGSLEAIIAQRLLRKKGGGRVATFEIMVPDAGIKHNIREGQTYKIPSSMQTGKAKGNVLMDNHLFMLVNDGLVEPEDALSLAHDYAMFEKKLKEANLIGFQPGSEEGEGNNKK
ncbi:MAG: PilT/PilU family type 4a pilus ATPase [Phycisphaerales bacterium]|nr:PilT/PilU family type 4a pilus ATPase [Phycisphaerales bacterium]